MKTKLAAILLALSVASCNTVVTETIDPVTGKTVARTTTTTVDSASVAAASGAVTILATPRGIAVHAEK